MLAQIAEATADVNDWLPDLAEILIAGALSGAVGAIIALIAARVGADREKRIQQELAAEAASRLAAEEAGNQLDAIWTQYLRPFLSPAVPADQAMHSLRVLVEESRAFTRLLWAAVPLLDEDISEAIEAHVRAIWSINEAIQGIDENGNSTGDFLDAVSARMRLVEIVKDGGNLMGALGAHRRGDDPKEFLVGVPASHNRAGK